MSELFLTILLGIFILLLFAALCFIEGAKAQGKRLAKKGDAKTLYDFQKKIHRIVDTPIVTFMVALIGPLFLEFSLQSEKVGDEEAATEWAKQAANPRFSLINRLFALQRAAELLKKQGKSEEANQLENEALKLQPELKKTRGVFDSTASEDAVAEHLRAGFLLSQGRFTEAIEVVDKFPSRENVFGLMMAARLRIESLRYMGRYEAAIAELHRDEEQIQSLLSNGSYKLFRLQKEPLTEPEYRLIEVTRVGQILMMVQIFLESGQTGAASEHWARVPVSVTDTNLALHCNATGAWLAAAQGNGEKSRKLLSNALTEKPEQESSATLIGYAIARACMALHDYDAAIQQLHTLVGANADKPLRQAEYRNLLGQCYQRLENMEAAQSEYQQVIAAGFEEAAFTSITRIQLARIQANSGATSYDTLQSRS